jgi:hypothetical protein
LGFSQRFSVEPQAGFSGVVTEDFHLPPAYRPYARSEGFGNCFFGGKSGGKAGNSATAKP